MLAMAASAPASVIVADWEAGAPGFFVYSGGGFVDPQFVTIPDTDPGALPGQVGDNVALGVSYDVSGTFGGFGQAFDPTPQDWSGFNSINFWMFGSNSGSSLQFEVFDNRSDPNFDTAERWEIGLLDDFLGWQEISFNFADFVRSTDFQPGGAPNDGFNLNEVWGYAFVLDGNAGFIGVDNITLRVPAPGALTLLGASLFGLGLARRRRRTA